MSARCLAIALALLVAGCAHRAAPPDELRAAVERALVERRLPPAALGIVGNMLAHEAPPPPAAPRWLEALFADPLAAADAAALWQRVAPSSLDAFFSTQAAPGDFELALAAYIRELGEAQRRLRAAAASFDEATMAHALEEGLPARLVPAVASGVDAAGLQRAAELFAAATARFVRALRAPGMRLPPPGERDSPLGRIVVGSAGADRHGAGAALIVDPGGDDRYERSPPLGGAVSVIVDLAGNDVYAGSDVAVRGLSALVDVEGDDRYRMSSGLAAAVAGASLLVDYAGSDVYEARFFAEGAALLGLAALIDASGDDRYTVEAYGQGYAFSGGTGLLWDRAGDDAYRAGGRPDAWQRGGGVAFAQGAAAGYRTPLGGGAGFLRDDAGDDRYEAQMFAQGIGYYYALGVLWDRGGRDAYRAVRYAQGNGVHQAVGVLRDESGEDRYELSLGAGQGMGLDMAVGLLADFGGDDTYRAGWLAQAAATGNGVGLLLDRAGENRFSITSGDPQGWGNAEWDRRLPSVAALVDEGARSTFERQGKPAAPPPPRVVHAREEADLRCPALPPAAAAQGDFVEQLYRVALRLPYGDPDAASYGSVLRRLIDDPAGAMARIPPAEFTLVHALGDTLQCALLAASDAEAGRMTRALERMLDEPGAPFLAVIAFALERRPGPPATMAKLRAALRASPRCSLQALTMNTASESEAREALASPCWRLAAAAYQRLQALGADRAEDVARLPYLAPAALDAARKDGKE
ncbi:MAG TPA: hypothetical protein VF211_13605 [Burkholderiales bacterium]